VLPSRDCLSVAGDRFHGKYANNRVKRQPGISRERRGGRSRRSSTDGLAPGKNYSARI